ncbi:MAG TPA: adenylyltransferase/cytidyltransferase family protein, partial [Dehalococcoidia bacterium]|nr:adenylyltransferase/cytidyltransferase family protein [Dehalococcoidia bacterium]
MGGLRRGILGGTFDPVHIAHLILGVEAYRALNLDRVTLVPTGEPWRKTQRLVTAAEHRLAMAKLAVEGDD